MKRMKKLYLSIVPILLLMVFFSCKSNNKPAPITYFPVLEISGSHYEIEKAIGETFLYQFLLSRNGDGDSSFSE